MGITADILEEAASDIEISEKDDRDEYEKQLSEGINSDEDNSTKEIRARAYQRAKRRVEQSLRREIEGSSSSSGISDDDNEEQSASIDAKQMRKLSSSIHI